MNQELKDVVANDGTKIESVQQLLQEIGKLEEKAYITGAKDTLVKVLTPLKSVAKLLEKTISNIEATLAMDTFVNKAAEEAVPAEVDAPPLTKD